MNKRKITLTLHTFKFNLFIQTRVFYVSHALVPQTTFELAVTPFLLFLSGPGVHVRPDVSFSRTGCVRTYLMCAVSSVNTQSVCRVSITLPVSRWILPLRKVARASRERAPRGLRSPPSAETCKQTDTVDLSLFYGTKQQITTIEKHLHQCTQMILMCPIYVSINNMLILQLQWGSASLLTLLWFFYTLTSQVDA